MDPIAVSRCCRNYSVNGVGSNSPGGIPSGFLKTLHSKKSSPTNNSSSANILLSLLSYCFCRRRT
ncbi:hypothetical protein Hamer_G029867, partial [Homarus americanus]